MTAIALRNASVSSVCPSPAAPKSFRLYWPAFDSSLSANQVYATCPETPVPENVTRYFLSSPRKHHLYVLGFARITAFVADVWVTFEPEPSHDVIFIGVEGSRSVIVTLVPGGR